MESNDDLKYTVAICNYNMAHTLGKSLKSILEQLDERFEVLVVDDGSNDGSQEILNELESEYEIFRWVEGENDNLAEARNQSFEEAKGKYILESLDTDDVYKPVIKDFVMIFEKLNEVIDKDFYLNAYNLNVAPRRLLLDKVPYRSLGYGEDKDLRRRLLAKDVVVILEINQPYKSIGYDYDRLDYLEIAYDITRVQFRSGISWSSFVKGKLKNIEYTNDIFEILISPIAYIDARFKGVYGLPDGWERWNKYYEEKEKNTNTLTDLEERYNLEIAKELSQQGKNVFLTKN